jgi:hypothetical protein
MLGQAVQLKFTDVSEMPAALIKIIALMTEAANTSVTSGHLYQTTRRHIADDSHFREL